MPIPALKCTFNTMETPIRSDSGRFVPLTANAPLAVNTGLYYVRNNEWTDHFFSVFVRMGDLVLADKSHQAALATLVKEQGAHECAGFARQRIWEKDNKLFLSGFSFMSDREL
jgi:hypothetical protein